MNRSILNLALAFAVVMGPMTSFGEEANPLKITAKLWTKFSADITSYPNTLTTVPTMGFDVTRAYLTANYKYNDDWSGFLQFDASRTVGSVTNTNLFSYVKDIYVQNSNMMDGMGFRFGLFPAPYDRIVDAIVGARWLTTNLNDSAAGGQSSSISFTPSHIGGVEFFGSVANKMVNYSLYVHNAKEGFTQTGATDTGLAYAATVDFLPFANAEGDLKKLGLAISADYWGPARSSTSTAVTEGALLLEAALHFQSSMFDVALEYATQNENYFSVNSGSFTSAGYGAILNFKFNENWSLFGKYQTGDTNFQNYKLRAASWLTAGPTYTVIKDKVMTALVYDSRAPSPINSAAGSVTVNSVIWNWAANF